MNPDTGLQAASGIAMHKGLSLSALVPRIHFSGLRLHA